ncbi:MAG: ribosome silencing factor [Candidatus Omnitrophica bacterium]|nr:ribosome silencing factor [Candidatus Omnitrophota bacterium]
MTIDSAATAKLIARLASDRKAEAIVILDMRRALGVADYFVIASGQSTRQVQAIAEHVWESLEERGGRVWHVEGLREGQWVLLDCGDIIVHVFHPQPRRFYGLERLWGDMPRVALPASVTSA